MRYIFAVSLFFLFHNAVEAGRLPGSADTGSESSRAGPSGVPPETSFEEERKGGLLIGGSPSVEVQPVTLSLLTQEEVYQQRSLFERKKRLQRFAAFQGGGLRGVWLLTVLKVLQERLAEQLRVGPQAQAFQRKYGANLAEWHGDQGLMPFHKLAASATGTSTGALALGGLTLRDPENPEQAKYSTQDMIDFYKQKGPEIFPSCSFENCRNNWCCQAPSWGKAVVKWLLCCGCCGCCRNGGGVFGPKYENEPLETILQEQFGEAKFKDALIPIQFTTYDTVSRGPLYLGSRSTPELEVWKGGRGSGSAPTFFRSFPVDIPLVEGTVRHARLMDGGIVENFPRAQAHHAAPLAAADDSQFSFDDGISLLIAIGTGRAAGVDWERLEHGGILSLVEPLIDIATSAPDEANAQRIKEMMGERYFDLQADIPADNDDMDDPDNIDPLIKDAKKYAETSEEITRLLKYLPGGELYEQEFEEYLRNFSIKKAKEAMADIGSNTSSEGESLHSKDGESGRLAAAVAATE